MNQEEEEDPQTATSSKGRSYTRRDFLKIAGRAGALAGAGAGLGGLVTACGGGTTTTTAWPSTTVGGATGREVKIGFVTPRNGNLASFGIPDKYCLDRAAGAIQAYTGA